MENFVFCVVKYFCFLLKANHALLESHAEFNRRL